MVERIKQVDIKWANLKEMNKMMKLLAQENHPLKKEAFLIFSILNRAKVLISDRVKNFMDQI